MQTDPALSTTDRLRAHGLTHRPSRWPGQREVIDATGVVLTTGNCVEVGEWLDRREAGASIDRLARAWQPQSAKRLEEMDAAAAEETFDASGGAS